MASKQIRCHGKRRQNSSVDNIYVEGCPKQLITLLCADAKSRFKGINYNKIQNKIQELWDDLDDDIKLTLPENSSSKEIFKDWKDQNMGGKPFGDKVAKAAKKQTKSDRIMRSSNNVYNSTNSILRQSKRSKVVAKAANIQTREKSSQSLWQMNEPAVTFVRNMIRNEREADLLNKCLHQCAEFIYKQRGGETTEASIGQIQGFDQEIRDSDTKGKRVSQSNPEKASARPRKKERGCNTGTVGDVDV